MTEPFSIEKRRCRPDAARGGETPQPFGDRLATVSPQRPAYAQRGVGGLGLGLHARPMLGLSTRAEVSR